MSEQTPYDRDFYLILKDNYLKEAEEMFGPKNEYLFDGLYFAKGRPQVHYSEMAKAVGETAFVVKLGHTAETDLTSGIFQISHEVVHLLSPVVMDQDYQHSGCLYLEEGMAVYFSKKITERNTGDMEIVDRDLECNPDYKEAYELYCELIKLAPEAVKKLREITPTIDEFTTETFHAAGLDVPQELIEKLLRRFHSVETSPDPSNPQ